MKSKLILALTLAFSAQAYAADVTKSPCEQPSLPNRQAAEIVVKTFNKHLTAYSTCIKKFIDEQQAIWKESTDPVKSQQGYDSAEAAIEEYNAMMEKVKANSPPPEE